VAARGKEVEVRIAMGMIGRIKSLVPAGIKRNIKRRIGPEAAIAVQLARLLPEIVCVDVGASYFPHAAWHVYLESPRVRWVAVEPNEANLGYLKSWPWPCHVTACTTGLSREGGPKTLHVTAVDSGSSLLEPVIAPSMKHRIRNLGYFFPLRRVLIDTLTLASVIDGQSTKAPVVVKLDTQGTELEILLSAEDALAARRIVGIEMESTLLADPVMRSSGKFWHACRELEALGFELLHLRPIEGVSLLGKTMASGRRYVNECDAVFALRRDVLATLPIDHRLAALAFYATNRFHEETIALIDDDVEVATALRAGGADLRALLALLRRCA
jgi:FkbM family methyltransferase